LKGNLVWLSDEHSNPVLRVTPSGFRVVRRERSAERFSALTAGEALKMLHDVDLTIEDVRKAIGRVMTEPRYLGLKD